MEIESRINEGDIVDVHFETLESMYRAKVLYIPATTGDCWRLKHYEQIVYVQQFAKMVKQ